MSQETATPTRLSEQLPVVRGHYGFNVPLAPTTWFRVGGLADVLYKPADLADLQHFLANCPPDIPVTVLGVASNVIIRDGGIEGVVIRLGGPFAGISITGNTLNAGAGALDSVIAARAQEAGLAGFEFLSGIPGTAGGGLRMNAGCYGREFRDITTAARALDRQGELHVLTPPELGFSYRHCGLPEDWIFVDCTLHGTPDAPEAIATRMAKIRADREDSQPVRARTGGSTFANPVQAKAWELIDRAGCRGLRLGGAQVSEKHCNFLINTGTANASDLEKLGEQVKNRVRENGGVDLRWEIQRLGRHQEGDR